MARSEQEDTAQAEFAVLVGVPLGDGVGAAALAACADGNGWNAAGEGDIGVCGAEAEVGAQAEMAIDGAEGFEKRRVGGSCAAGRSPIF